jgi:hypothetical protein
MRIRIPKYTVFIGLMYAGCVQIPHLLHAGRRVLGALRNLYVDELLGRVQLEPVQSHTVLLDPRRQHAHYQYNRR